MAVIMRAAALVTGTAFTTPGITATWWAPGTVGGSTADATDILARYRASWDAVKAALDDAVSIDFDPICIAVEATTGALTGAFAGTDPTTVVGTNATDALPRQTQGLVQFSTASVIGGRRVRGRLFIPGPCTGSNTTSGSPTTTYSSLLVTAFGSLLTAGATASQLVVWHRPQGGSGGASPVVTGVGSATRWSVLRSRRS